MKDLSDTDEGGGRVEDLQIIELYFSRDEQAITETDRKYGKLCRSIIYNILISPEDTEECVNDTYLGTWNSIPPARPTNFSAFVCRIVRNLSLKRLEYNKAMKRDPEVYVSYSELENVIADDEIDPFITDEHLGKIISRFLRAEKEEARNVFLRRYWFFDPIGTIAEKYGFSESKVKNMLYHSRNRLREYLRKEGVIV